MPRLVNVLAPLARRAVQAAGKPQNFGQTRSMSGGASIEEEIAEMGKWRTITFVAVPGCLALTAYMMSGGHHEAHEKVAYPHLRIRNKPFPWGTGDCGLFEEC